MSASPAAFFLTALPPELVNLVVTKIESESTLCNLARCSRQLYLCTTLHLYGDIEIQEDGKQQDERLVMLTTVLLRRPDLAKLVRRFTLDVTQPQVEPMRYISPEMIQIDGVFTTAVDPSRLSQEELINCLGQYDYKHMCRHDFILSFLLPSMLNVEELVLMVGINIQSHFLEDAIRKAVARDRPLGTQPPFRALTVFDQSPHDNRFARKISFIASLLKLPAIREISGSFEKFEPFPHAYFSGEYDEKVFADSNLMELESSSSPLTSLDLATYDVPAIDMRHILRVPRALKHFSFMVRTFHDFDCADISNSLEPQKDCLESINIYCDESIQLEVEEENFLAPMASFTRFSALKVFKSAGIFLSSTVRGNDHYSLINIFPPSLEVLHVTRFRSDFDTILETLERLVAYKSPRQIPLLKTLVLEETLSYSMPPFRLLLDILRGGPQVAMEKLRRVAKSQNVILEVTEGWSSGQALED